VIQAEEPEQKFALTPLGNGSDFFHSVSSFRWYNHLMWRFIIPGISLQAIDDSDCY